MPTPRAPEWRTRWRWQPRRAGGAEGRGSIRQARMATPRSILQCRVQSGTPAQNCRPFADMAPLDLTLAPDHNGAGATPDDLPDHSHRPGHRAGVRGRGQAAGLRTATHPRVVAGPHRAGPATAIPTVLDTGPEPVGGPPDP